MSDLSSHTIKPFDVIVSRSSVVGNPNLLTVVFQNSPELTIRVADWVDFELKLGEPITQYLYDTCSRRACVVSAVALAERYLRHKPRTSAELMQFLSQKMVSEEDAREALQLLSASGAIDDGLYTRLFAAQQKSKMTKKAIEWKMRNKGVPSDIIQTVLAAEVHPSDEEKLATQLAEKYIRQKGEPQGSKEVARLGNFLLRRGVNSERVRTILSGYFDK